MSRSWVWPLSSAPLFPDGPGRFGAKRAEDVHTGIDLYCELGTEVRSVEDGEVVAIEWFTGQHVPTADGVPSTWWNDTKIILIRGASGVVGYGECTPLEGIAIGARVRVGQRIAVVDTAVLKSFKGRPMVMLHLELYRNLEVQPDGTNTMWWKLGESQPENLVDPSFCLVDAAAKGNRGYSPKTFQLEDYTGQDFRDHSAPSKAAKWWGAWGGDWENPPSPREVVDASIVVIFNREGEVLLLQRHDADREYPGGCWGFPGGKNDPGETPQGAAEREAHEETGLVVECSDVIATRRSVSPRGRHFNLSIFFAGPIQNGPRVTFPTKEHQDYGWYTPGAPVTFLAGEVTRWVLEDLIGWSIRDGEPPLKVSTD